MANYLCSGCQLAQLALIYTECDRPEKIGTIHRTTLLFLSLSSTFVLWKTFYPAPGVTKTQSWSTLIASGIGGTIAFRNSLITEKIDLDELDLSKELQQTVSAYYQTPEHQWLYQALLTAQMVHVLGRLICGDVKNILFASLIANSAAMIFSRRLRLIQVNYRHDISLQFTAQGPQNPRFQAWDRPFFRLRPPPTYTRSINPELTYEALLPIRKVSQSKDDECSVCSDPADSSSCSKGHPICKSCFIAHCAVTMHQLGRKLLQEVRVVATAHFVRDAWAIGPGKFKGMIYKYIMNRDELPLCPLCREIVSRSLPQFNIRFRQGKIEFRKQEEEQDDAKSLPDPGFWSGVFLGLTAIQLTLACAQYTHPHLAGTLYNIQKLMLPLDLMFLSGLAIAEQKQTTTEPYVRPEWAAKAAAAASGLLAVGLILYRWKSTPPSLTHHLKGIIPDEALANIKMTALPPASLRFMQWSFGTRMFALLALASLSPNKKTHVAAAAISALTLLKLSTINWVCIERTYTDLHWAASSVTTQLHFMIPNLNEVGSTTEQYQQTLQSLADYSAHFFEKSSWDYHWLYHYYDGVYVGRDLVFEALASPEPLLIHGYDFFDLLMSWGGFVRSSEWSRTVLELEIAGKSVWAPLF